MAEQKEMKNLDILDIGGGYSMNSRNENNNFNFVAPEISNIL
jgi:hypothetical protein